MERKNREIESRERDHRQIKEREVIKERKQR